AAGKARRRCNAASPASPAAFAPAQSGWQPSLRRSAARWPPRRGPAGLDSHERLFPRLADEGLAELVVALLLDQALALGGVDRTRRDQHVMRPQGHLAIALLAREALALPYHHAAQSRAARLRLDQHQAQARHLGAVAHDEGTADRPAVLLGDHRALPG